jgi:RHS repeat-associated protein
MASDFDFRFSSEVFDTETGLSYYNYRYYSAELGRWLNRDLYGESGGLNLYGMVKNNPVNDLDRLGLATITKTYNDIAFKVLKNGKQDNYVYDIEITIEYHVECIKKTWTVIIDNESYDYLWAYDDGYAVGLALGAGGTWRRSKRVDFENVAYTTTCSDGCAGIGFNVLPMFYIQDIFTVDVGLSVGPVGLGFTVREIKTKKWWAIDTYMNDVDSIKLPCCK